MSDTSRSVGDSDSSRDPESRPSPPEAGQDSGGVRYEQTSPDLDHLEPTISERAQQPIPGPPPGSAHEGYVPQTDVGRAAQGLIDWGSPLVKAIGAGISAIVVGGVGILIGNGTIDNPLRKTA